MSVTKSARSTLSKRGFEAGVEAIAACLGKGESQEPAMKTQGEIEAAICEGVSRFAQEYMGPGPKHISAHLIGDLLVVRLQGVLTAAEQHLVKTLTSVTEH